MKIGILTYHRSCNFGANLQAASTCGYLRKRGFQPVLIDYFPESLSRFSPSDIQASAHNNFIFNNFDTTKLCSNSNDIACELRRLDIRNIIIGSDAVFNVTPNITRLRPSRKSGLMFVKPIETTVFPNPFWGDFTDFLDNISSIQVISASSQNTRFRLLSPFTIKKMRKRLELMDCISVRDDWTKQMVSFITEGNIVPEITPDPVFAYNANFNSPSIDEVSAKLGMDISKAVLFGFRSGTTPSNKWFEDIFKIVKSEGYKPIFLPMPSKLKNREYEIDWPISPDIWYSAIKNCRAYIGNNMHPIVIALHNSTPFFSFDQYGIRHFICASNETSSKTYHILEKADMLDFRTRAISMNMLVPPPREVWAKIRSFDRAKCGKFAQSQLESYMAMMERVVSIFK